MNVYDATNARLKAIFSEFDNVYVSFSGGKDSGVLLNMTIEYARKYYPGRKIGVMHLDYEAQYQMTTEYVTKTLSENADVLDVYRCCVPFKVTTCTSMHQTYWRPWEPDKKDIWVSPWPRECFSASDFDFFTPSMWDYDFQNAFSEWIHKRSGAKRTCCLVGIRTQESLHRWRAIHSDNRTTQLKGMPWTKQMGDDIYNAYPIYDWLTEDIWIANGKFGWSYNRLYDVFYQAGVSIDQMRVASPFISQGQETLKLYRVIEPNTWGKLVSRVNGVNFTGIYGGTTAMGWRSISLPPGHTWKSYMEFLLSTLPKKTANNYKKKLAKSMEFWRTKGGSLSSHVVEKLRERGIPLTVGGPSNYKTTKLPIMMNYLDDIDIAEFSEIPTYKRMCVCIMKNDHLCKFMGFSLTKREDEIRQAAERKYANADIGRELQ